MAAASRRAFSALASKIHPQLPLTPRESQQLLNLLTTSFRAHLDREHPVTAPDRSAKSLAVRSEAPVHAESSYSAASQHIESIITNPLFALRPRRGSDAATGTARTILNDPMGWFLNKIVTGSADISMAAVCLDVLDRAPQVAKPGTLRDYAERKPGTIIAEWLKNSGQDISREFVESIAAKPSRSGVAARSFFDRLARHLIAEGQEHFLWQWFLRHPDKRTQETGLAAERILVFRANILVPMLESSLKNSSSLDEALRMFVHTHGMVASPEHGLPHKVLQPIGSRILNYITRNPHTPVSPGLYRLFLNSSKDWSGSWRRVVQSILWLHHPSEPSAVPGLAYIRDPQGALLASSRKLPKNMRRLLVHLCLGVARQLLAEERYTDAQYVLEFTSKNFPELVSTEEPTQTLQQSKAQTTSPQREQQNLDLLDRLLPT
ncbi:hypothetical protein BS50DRAFT_374634 [Corynespora cassiicola Philippines]|uniref:Uncharacterized protein n=1 Tax=Corynespora cassiicola Philippines TaxID=1448308 RepID=A0A2T2NNF8_CORCC|nr:hypothetical protein BS50DRAFT_374634 [Corynespora cassiicola Philippines]